MNIITLKTWRAIMLRPPGSFSPAYWIARALVAATAYVVCFLFIWKGLIRGFGIPSFLLPTPESVIKSFLDLPHYYAHHLSVTLFEAMIGAIGGFLTGFLLGIVLRYGGYLGRVLNPLILSSQVFPKEALAPLFLVFMGFGVVPKIVISSLICFFPVVINTHKGLQAAPREYDQLMHVLGASRWHVFWRCHLPFAAKYVFASLRVCATLSIIGAVVGEFVGSSAGLGHVIRAANADIGTERIYAALLLLGLLGAVFYGTAVLIEHLFFAKYTQD